MGARVIGGTITVPVDEHTGEVYGVAELDGWSVGPVEGTRNYREEIFTLAMNLGREGQQVSRMRLHDAMRFRDWVVETVDGMERRALERASAQANEIDI